MHSNKWRTFLLGVRIDGFKLEGGELFKKDFRKLLKQEWIYDGNQVEDALGHEAQAQQGAQAHQGVQAQQGAQAQRITRSMARALGQEYNEMALLISFVE